MGYIDYNIDLYEAVEDLLDEELISEDMVDAYGIALQVIHQGYDSLSAKQRFVYNRDITPLLVSRAKEIEVLQIKNSWPE